MHSELISSENVSPQLYITQLSVSVLLVQFETLPEEGYHEGDNDAGHGEQQQDGHSGILHIGADGKIKFMDFYQQAVSVGHVRTAGQVCQSLQAHHQFDVVSSSGRPGTVELVVTGFHILFEWQNTIILNDSIKVSFITLLSPALGWHCPGPSCIHTHCECQTQEETSRNYQGQASLHPLRIL